MGGTQPINCGGTNIYKIAQKIIVEKRRGSDRKLSYSLKLQKLNIF